MVNEPVPFLANILLVAHADGALSANELGQLEAIRKDYKIKKSDFSTAVRLVEQGDHRLTPIGSFADKVKNLELMLRVAYADSDLDPKELDLISAFCKAIGLHEEQLDVVRMEALSSYEQASRLCHSCGAENAAESRFCASCGTDLSTTGQDIQVKFNIPQSGTAIEFAESTAASFPKALALAKTSQDFQTCQKGRKTWHMASYKGDNLADAIPLAEALIGMRNRNLYVDGEETQWDSVFGFTWCASQRATAYQPLEYCFGLDENRLNPWGCKQSRMDWAEWSDWFCFGNWEKSGLIGRKWQWRFDKDRIRHELTTNLFRFRYCPHLTANLAEAVLAHLPDIVVPDTDPNWDYHEDHEEIPGAIKVVRQERSNGFAFTNEFWSNGVRPKGLKAIETILLAAFRDVGLDSSLGRALLK